MRAELQINNSPQQGARFIAWAPSPCRIRITDPSGAPSPTVTLTVRAQAAPGGGAVVFRAGTSGAFANTLSLTVPIGGASVPFFVAGKFLSPSTNAGDVTVEARMGTTLVGSVPLMVRVRKNANKLTTGERDRFVSALAQVNNQGSGRYQDFCDMHATQLSLDQGHGFPGFLPWHRGYLLDLERELQTFDPSVTIPYWRFDQPAPNIFTQGFLGVADSIGTVQFSASNPLRFWKTTGVPGINRRPLFPTSSAPNFLRTEAQTLGLGNRYALFRTLEDNPHGFAHTSFGGLIRDPTTAPRDPLFFLLHCNVDRLWAKWQKQFNRFDPAVAASFEGGSHPPGHKLGDTMWPWNGVTGGTRPPTAPGGELASSPCVNAPGASPRVQDCLDFQGRINAAAVMGFGYDDTSL